MTSSNGRNSGPCLLHKRALDLHLGSHPSKQEGPAGIAALRFPRLPDMNDADSGAGISEQDILIGRVDTGAHQ